MNIIKKIIVIFSALVVFLALPACQKQSDNTFQGYVEGELLYIASPFSGELKTLNVHRGEKVTKNSCLFTLDQEPEFSQLTAAEKNLKQAKSNLENLVKGQRQTVLAALKADINRTKAELQLAEVRVKRYQELYKKGATEKDTLDAIIAEYNIKQAQLKQTEANLAEATLGSRQDLIKAQEATVATATAQVQQAKWALQEKTQNAPTDAIVFDTFYWPGEWVMAGQPVLALLAPQYIRFIFFVPEPKISLIHLGEPITVNCDSCDRDYTATISYISPEAEYTPPVIYSRESNYKLVYRIKAIPNLTDAYFFHPGQPVYVTLNKKL